MLTTDLPDEGNTVTDSEPVTPTVLKTPSVPLDEATKKKFERDNKLAHNYLLNNMSNPWFDLFVSFKSAKLFGPNLRQNMVKITSGKENMSSGK